ncbi:MAG: helix-hairpin-helix domain-containing protein [Gemmatimonadota bacterium]|nr:helix-hairpin-helix domain-containing protein [Gemmatimonadota bacterium]
MRFLTANEKRAAAILCVLASLAAGLRLMQVAARTGGPGESVSWKPAAGDSLSLHDAAVKIEAGRLPINVNLADKEFLQRVDGIGPVLAGRIVKERTRGGPFLDMDGLAARVRGIGPSSARRLEGQLSFSPVPSKKAN